MYCENIYFELTKHNVSSTRNSNSIKFNNNPLFVLVFIPNMLFLFLLAPMGLYQIFYFLAVFTESFLPTKNI